MGTKSTHSLSRDNALELIKNYLSRLSNNKLADIIEVIDDSELMNFYIDSEPEKYKEFIELNDSDIMAEYDIDGY